MELLKQHFQSKIDCFVKVYKNGEQHPMVIFKDEKLKPLEILFNLSDRRLDFKWYESFIKKTDLLENENFEFILKKEIQNTLMRYTIENNNLLSKQMNCVFFEGYENKIDNNSFLLELTKYYNEDSLFSIFGFLDSKFKEIKIIEEDQLSIIIRKNSTLISLYFSKEEPIIIDTSELIFYLKYWFDFLQKWKTKGIPGLS